MKKKKVVVAMSGGVDSSMSAYFLKEAGYEVLGVTMQLFGTSAHIKRAQDIACKLSIEHEVIKLEDVFKKKVIDYFCKEYICGGTPNPCLRCNKFIKFGKFMNIAAKKSEFFATGHYARVVYNPQIKSFELRKGLDTKKDQSYVLFALAQKQLSRLLLPMGDRTKEEVRAIAKKLALPIEDSDESQDICFIPDKDYPKFISAYSESFSPKEGDIITSEGVFMARHKGTIFYTIGQRKGLGIAYQEPLYVIGIDSMRNRVIVGRESQLYADTFEIKNVSFTDPRFEMREFMAFVKIRYHHLESEAVVRNISKSRWQVEFKEKQKAITPGQGAVFYDNGMVLGGGIISRVVK